MDTLPSKELRYEIETLPGPSGTTNYRITDKTTDSRVATCFLPENARLVTDALNAYSAGEPPAAPKEWRCFHCDDVFTNWGEARNHFGFTPEDGPPACKTTRGEDSELYHLKRRLELYQREDTELHQALHAKDAEMHTKVRQSEEAGYARGLEDAKKYPETIGLMRAAQPPVVNEDTARLDFLGSQRKWGDCFMVQDLDSGDVYVRPWRSQNQARWPARIVASDIRTAIDLARATSTKGVKP